MFDSPKLPLFVEPPAVQHIAYQNGKAVEGHGKQYGADYEKNLPPRHEQSMKRHPLHKQGGNGSTRDKFHETLSGIYCNQARTLEKTCLYPFESGVFFATG